MKLEQKGDHYIFTPATKNNSRVRGMLVLQSVYFNLPGSIAIVTAFFRCTVSILITIIIIAADVVLIVAGMRYAKKAGFNEKITITPNALIITVGEKAQQYNLSSIDRIHYTGYAAKTAHPLKTGGFDYMGFETRELEIARIHDEGHIKLS